MLSAKALDYVSDEDLSLACRETSLSLSLQIDQHCAVSIRLDGTYIPPELRPLLQQRPLHLHVTTQDAFSFESKTFVGGRDGPFPLL